MADKEFKQEDVPEKTTPVVHEAKVAPLTPKAEKEKARPVPRLQQRKWVIGIIVAALALYVIIVLVGAWAFHAMNNNSATNSGNGAVTTQQFGGRMRNMGSTDRTFTSQSTDSDGLTATTTTTTYTQTQGVVTAVNSDSVVVAGNGKTQTIKTNSSTTYVSDTKPAVNDTVVIVGTKDGDTITATEVQVYNQ